MPQASWTSVADESTDVKHTNPFESPQHSDGDGSGFLHPESTLESNRELQSSSWAKERSAQQLELEHVDGISQEGICHRINLFIIKSLHVIDLCAGIGFIVYGSLMRTRFATPAMAAVTFCLILGSFHLASSLLGIISYFFASCKRFGLSISAFAGPYFALVYLTIVISLAANSKGFLQYLEDHKTEMFLKDSTVENAERLMPLTYSFLAVFIFVEASRFRTLFKLKEHLIRRDSNNALTPRAAGFANESLTKALIEDRGDRGDSGTVTSSRAGGSAAVSETPSWWDGAGP